MSRISKFARQQRPSVLAIAAATLLFTAWLPSPADGQERDQPRSATRQQSAAPSTPSAPPPSRATSPAPSRSSNVDSSSRGGRTQSERSDRRASGDRRSAATQTDRPADVANASDASDSAYSSRDRRSYRRGGGHRGYYRHGYSYPYYRSYWRSGWWGPWWGWGWDYPGSIYVNHGPGDGLGALDLDVSPEEAAIFINGQQVGIADNFDGFPQYLWLKEDTYDLVIYLPGYETIARQVSIYPGLVIDVEDQMVPGTAIPPEELASTSTENRDERLRRNDERRATVDAERRAREDEWRERAREYRRRHQGGDGNNPSALDARSAPGRLELDIQPGDASVYLDGRFLGSADELQGLSGDLLVDAGEHEIEVVHPDYETAAQSFEAEAGELQALKLHLRAKG
ncbi:MAG: PEGA domain-containing protein [Acidobacteriota bacterium]